MFACCILFVCGCGGGSGGKYGSFPIRAGESYDAAGEASSCEEFVDEEPAVGSGACDLCALAASEGESLVRFRERELPARSNFPVVPPNAPSRT